MRNERPRLSDRAMAQFQRRLAADARLLEIMELVISEWDSEPMSVQCFDLRIVEEAKQLQKERKNNPLPFE